MPKSKQSSDLFTCFFDSLGRKYMPEWVEVALDEAYTFFSKAGEDHLHASVSIPFTNMDMRGIEAFILLGVKNLESWYINERGFSNNRSLQAEIIINTKSLTKIVAQHYKVYDQRLFFQHVREFADSLRHQFEIGYFSDFGELLNKFVSLLINMDLKSKNWDLDDELTSSIFDSLKDYSSTDLLNSSDANQIQGTLENYLDDDWFEDGSEKPADNQIVLDIEPSKADPIFIKLADLTNSGASDTKQLVEQLTLMSLGKGFQTNRFNKFPSLVEIKKDNSKLPKINKELLLAGVYGSPIVMEKIALEMGVPTRQIRFPRDVILARQALKETPMMNKSFHHCGVEATFFHHAQSFKSEIQIDNTDNELNELFLQKAPHAPVTINYSLIIELLQEYQKPLSAQLARKKSNRLKNFLAEKVIGQKCAIDIAADLYFGSIHPNQSSSSLKVESLILLGASQSGKSLLADSFSEALNFIDEGVGYESLFLPMESYSDSKSVLKLIGSGSQYVDSALGYLTLAAELNPRTCFVFENFEKAHPIVQEALLTLLDSGELPDNTSNRLVNFKQCFFLFTTSVGSSQFSAIEQVGV